MFPTKRNNKNRGEKKILPYPLIVALFLTATILNQPKYLSKG